MLTRRGFFIGVGSLLMVAFVRKATAFSRNAGQPLILPPAKRPEETLYLYKNPDYRDYGHDDDDEYDADDAYYNVGKWRVSLGPDQPVAPPPPMWREYLSSRGHRLETNDDIMRVCREKSLRPEELDRQLDGFGWEDMWDNFTGPKRRPITCSRRLILALLIPN